MRASKLLVVLFMLAITAEANAAKLVYTGYQDHASNPLIPDNGERVYTLAVQILSTDRIGQHYAAATGQLVPGVTSLAVSLVLTGSDGVSPIQLPRNVSASATGVGNYQQTQTDLDNGRDPSSVALVRAADSFFYSSGAGQLTTEGEDGAVQVVGDPKLNAPGLSPNPYALMWSPVDSPNSATNTTGSSMSITAQWGTRDRTSGTVLSEASFVGVGVYPLAQIVLPVGGSISFEIGPSRGIQIGNDINDRPYNVLGGSVGTDPAGIGAFLSYDPNAYLTNMRAIGPIVGSSTPVPEPSTLVLVAVGLAALMARKLRPGMANRLATFSLLGGVVISLVCSLPSRADATTLHAGDILLTASMVGSGEDALLNIDPVTGDRTILSDATHGSGPLFVFDATGTFQSSVLRISDDRLVVAARNGIFYIDPTTGDRTLLTDSFASDLVAVGDQFYAVNYVGLYRIDPVTGATNLLSFDGRGDSISTWNGDLFINTYDRFNLAGQLLQHNTINPAGVDDVVFRRWFPPTGSYYQVGRIGLPYDQYGFPTFYLISDVTHGAGPLFSIPHGVSVVPEPSTIVLAMLSIAGLAICKLRM